MPGACRACTSRTTASPRRSRSASSDPATRPQFFSTPLAGPPPPRPPAPAMLRGIPPRGPPTTPACATCSGTAGWSPTSFRRTTASPSCIRPGLDSPCTLTAATVGPRSSWASTPRPGWGDDVPPHQGRRQGCVSSWRHGKKDGEGEAAPPLDLRHERPEPPRLEAWHRPATADGSAPTVESAQPAEVPDAPQHQGVFGRALRTDSAAELSRAEQPARPPEGAGPIPTQECPGGGTDRRGAAERTVAGAPGTAADGIGASSI
mmetsp:Transcript_22949/g.54425  ORF Transcript_22949/g.54425 Transcript_22949/m.54425 type:complete len:262 (-) Transcript_22949:516-1301(-)